MVSRFDEVLELSSSARRLDEIIRSGTKGADEIQLTLFVSCYNEQDFLTDTLRSAWEAVDEAKLKAEMVIIDDGSQDGSPSLIRQFIAQNPDRLIIYRQNKVNRGLAQNYIDGAFLGRGKYYRLICGDNSHPKESLVKIFSKIGQADMIIPYYIESKGKPLSRRILSRAFTALINVITGNRLRYYNGLALHLRANIMRWHPNSHGFGFQADIICMLLDQGYTYVEVPILDIHSNDKSQALTGLNVFSVGHTILDIFIRKLSRTIHQRRKRKKITSQKQSAIYKEEVQTRPDRHEGEIGY